MLPIPITVLGGYLGSGKTTLLNAVLGTATGRRIGVVVNDFGELGVDAALLADQAVDGLVDLPNGCVCCTLGTELGTALDAMSERRPRLDHIVIEASGVADPSALAAWGTVPGFVPGGVFVLAAADSVRRQADDRYVGGEVRRQLDAADVVIVTKADLVSDEQLEQVGRWLYTTTDAPWIVADPTTPTLLLLPTTPHRSREVGGLHLPENLTGIERRPHDHTDVHATWTWRASVASSPSLDMIRAFVDALPDDVIRAKGLVGTGGSSGVVVQVVGRHRVVIATSVPPEESGIVVIGPARTLDVAELERLASTYLA